MKWILLFYLNYAAEIKTEMYAIMCISGQDELELLSASLKGKYFGAD